MGGAILKNIGSKYRDDSASVMPALFIGHGSPMNALADNGFTQFLNREGAELPRPKAILVISAHWETRGTQVLKVDPPKTIHDFYGFPKALHEVQYPAPGAVLLADQIEARLKAHEVITSSTWGLDHGTWSILKHMYPMADIPVLQLSLNQNLDLRQHFAFAQELKFLRQQGVLIVGSGNIVHNLRAVDFDPEAKPMDWAIEFDEMIKKALQERDLATLFAEKVSNPSLWHQAVPSLEHYLPLLYILGVSDENAALTFPYEEIQMGSISMRAVRT